MDSIGLSISKEMTNLSQERQWAAFGCANLRMVALTMENSAFPFWNRHVTKKSMQGYFAGIRQYGE